jgi:hypothetical protein
MDEDTLGKERLRKLADFMSKLAEEFPDLKRFQAVVEFKDGMLAQCAGQPESEMENSKKRLEQIQKAKGN